MKVADDGELNISVWQTWTMILQRFFRTGPGQHVEDNIFIGVIVPQSGHVAKNSVSSRLVRLECSLYSCIHEAGLWRS